jgi:cold shock CspA family protein
MTVTGFGFLRPDNAGEDVFFHRTALEDASIETVFRGDKFEFVRVK